MKSIRASEIGTYLYCQRAWWFQRQGIESQNQMELAGGSEIHRKHGRKVIASSFLKILAYLLLLLALVILTIYSVDLIIR
jgi:CRISPR/Cas system-associated exonuclease Cas4 (RecB family)